MPRSAKIIATWDALIKATDASIAELSMKLYSDPANATHYQRNITILMLRKQEAIIRKRMGEDNMTREAYQELIEELAENTKYLSTGQILNPIKRDKLVPNPKIETIRHLTLTH